MKKKNWGVTTTVDVTLHLSKNKGDIVSHLEYSRVIGSLMYLISCNMHSLCNQEIEQIQE